jgi:hypothetical protein
LALDAYCIDDKQKLTGVFFAGFFDQPREGSSKPFAIVTTVEGLAGPLEGSPVVLDVRSQYANEIASLHDDSVVLRRK